MPAVYPVGESGCFFVWAAQCLGQKQAGPLLAFWHLQAIFTGLKPKCGHIPLELTVALAPLCVVASCVLFSDALKTPRYPPKILHLYVSAIETWLCLCAFKCNLFSIPYPHSHILTNLKKCAAFCFYLNTVFLRSMEFDFSHFQVWISMEKRKYGKIFLFPYYCPNSVFWNI